MDRTVKVIVTARYEEVDGTPRIYTHEEYGMMEGNLLQDALVYAINDLHNNWDSLNIREVIGVDLILDVNEYRDRRET